jgi:two-component system response regulator ChvI
MATTLDQNIASSSAMAEAALLGPIKKADAIRILIVEGDQIYRDILSDELSEQGFAVHSFADGAALLGSLDIAIDADVIILDWGLPQTLGIDLLPQLRRRGVNLPVVFLSGRAPPAHESLAFDRGAIDFIDKARGVEVLVRRLKRVVRTDKPAAAPQMDNRMVCDELVLEPETSRAYWNDVDLALTLGEYNMVHLLASKPGHFVTYRAVYDRLRHEGFIAGYGADGYRANVRSAIKRIRNKFRALDPTFNKIKNYPDFGYCWKKPSDANG